MKIMEGRFSLSLVTGALLALGTVWTAAQSPALAWDATSKKIDAKRGETNVYFAFALTNTSPNDVVVNAVRTSCGCTIAKVPTLPWRLAPSSVGQLDIAVDLRGKRGLLSKIVSVDSSVGLTLLTVNVNIPEPDPRELNRMLAQADRQAVFRNDCASCHAHPVVGKTGEALYKTACGICHESDHRATMVPDLKALKKPTDNSYWDTWVRHGKPGTLMPAFSKLAGGPLEEEQITSLVKFLSDHFRPVQSRDFGDPFPASPGSSF